MNNFNKFKYDALKCQFKYACFLKCLCFVQVFFSFFHLYRHRDKILKNSTIERTNTVKHDNVYGLSGLANRHRGLLLSSLENVKMENHSFICHHIA